MSCVGEAVERQFEFGFRLVFVVASEVFRSEVVAGGIALFVPCVGVSVAQHEFGLRVLGDPSSIRLWCEERDFVVVAAVQGFLFDGLELPDVEVGSGDGVLADAQFRFQSESGCVGRGVGFVNAAVVAQSPWDDLTADDVQQGVFEHGEFARLLFGLVDERAEMPTFERVHVEYVSCGRGTGSDDEANDVIDLAGDILHRTEEQATVHFMTAFRITHQLIGSLFAPPEETGKPHFRILRIKAQPRLRSVIYTFGCDPLPRYGDLDDGIAGFLFLRFAGRVRRCTQWKEREVGRVASEPYLLFGVVVRDESFAPDTFRTGMSQQVVNLIDGRSIVPLGFIGMGIAHVYNDTHALEY